MLLDLCFLVEVDGTSIVNNLGAFVVMGVLDLYIVEMVGLR